MLALFTDAVAVTEDQVTTAANTLQSMNLMGILKIVVLIVVLIILVQLLSRLLTRVIERSRIDKSAHGFLRTTIKVLLWFVAVTIVASSLGVNITSLIAVLSVAGLAVSLALQGALGNLASGLVILTTKPFRVGDYVQIGANEGFVEEITMTHTKLVAWDHRTIFIPNSTITVSEVINYSVDGKRRVDMNVSVGYDNDVDAVKAALTNALENVPQIQKDQPLFVRLNAYEANTIQYQMRCWCTADDYWDVWYDLLEEIKRVFDREGITFSYPHMNVHLDK